MKSNKAFLGISIGVALVSFAGFAYWSMGSRTESAPLPTSSPFLVRPHSPTKGSADAKVTLVEFLDPECEACRAMHPIVKDLLAEYQGRLRLVIRYLPFHASSLLAASALEEARELGKFDEALDKLFETQPEWGDHAFPKPELISISLRQIGIEDSKLGSSYLIAKHRSKIEMDAADGEKLGITRTPTFFVNGKMLNEIGYEPLKEAIEKALTE